MTTTDPQADAPVPATSVSDLTVDEQAVLTAGADMWHTASLDRLGIPGFGLTDGPSGARGFQFTGTSSMSLPCGTALASTWNRELIGRVGRLLGDEARSKDASVLLAPTVNIHRHPLGGRNFECYSEDPYLTAEIAVAFITGVQSRGVACSVKHFACNDQETDRMEIDTVADERTRREIYFPPFEAAVKRAGVWSIMAAYNRVDGIHCSQHPGLLTDLLRGEWGFDGVVVSDWFGAHSIDALTAGLDLEMPGPGQWLGENLTAAIDAGDVAAEAVEQAARRVLDLVERTAPSRVDPGARDGAAEVELARTAATEAVVLLSNDGVLPLDTASVPKIALIGWRADLPEIQGGGSAQVSPPYVITPLHGITERAEPGSVEYRSGRVTARLAPLTGRLLASPDGEAGRVHLDYFPAGEMGGTPLRTESQLESTAVWLGEPAPGVPNAFSVRMTAMFSPDISGRWTLSISGIGLARLFMNGELLGDTANAVASEGLLGLFTAAVECPVDVEASRTYEVVAEFDTGSGDVAIPISGMTIAASAPAEPDAIDLAVRAATNADVAVVVVGQEERVTEGQDSTTMDLPEAQVALIRHVAAANPRTVVVVNAAVPVTMDWAGDVAAVVQMSYLGQEAGAALAAVLFGDADASGRLTTTHPYRIEDSPAFPNFPGKDGSVSYEEGVFVGYRHYDTNRVDPRWCFGHGLSYTTFAHSALNVVADGVGAVVSLEVTNTGERTGSEVVQVYVRHVDAPLERPDRELKGFEKVRLAPGASTTVTVALDERAFAYWDTELHDWNAPTGTYEILVGSSSRDIHQTAPLYR